MGVKFRLLGPKTLKSTPVGLGLLIVTPKFSVSQEVFTTPMFLGIWDVLKTCCRLKVDVSFEG